jgi:ribosomal protein S18 acetylase RimI-like enzyme
MSVLRFETINVETQRQLCIDFRRDSFVCSFADGNERFDADGGADGYIDWLKVRIAEFPGGFAHVWEGDRIIGQLELRLRPDGSGYANLFYLSPTARGLGWGSALNDYAVAFFRSKGATIARLCVSPTNFSAIRFYLKHGWRDTGSRPDRPGVHVYELSL